MIDLGGRSLFTNGMYEEGGEGAYRLGVLVSSISQWGSDLSLRTPWRRYDIIIFLCVLEVSSWLDIAASRVLPESVWSPGCCSGFGALLRDPCHSP